MNTRDGKFAVFIDIDGTLMGGNPQALEKNLAVIQKVRSLGHKVFISTGRSTAYIPEEVKAEDCFDGVISGAGAIIRMDGREIFKKLMPYETVLKMGEILQSINQPSALEGEKDMYYFDTSDYTDKTWIKLEKGNYVSVITEEIPIEKFTVFGQAPKEIGESLGEDYVVLQHRDYCEIIRRECSKARAMKYVMESLNLPMSHSIAIGDSMNDYDMIEEAGFGVAMGNAIDEIKELADITVAEVNNAGVAEALCRIFNI